MNLNKKFKIPTKPDNNGNRNEEYQLPTFLPEQLIHTRLTFQDYFNIVEKCKKHINKKKKLVYLPFLPFLLFAGFIVFTIYFKRTPYVYISIALFVITFFFFYFIYQSYMNKWDNDFDKIIIELNSLYNSKGVKIERKIKDYGKRKNRISKIYIHYQDDPNLYNQQTTQIIYVYPQQNEIEMQSLQNHQPYQPYYPHFQCTNVPSQQPLGPPSENTVCLNKENDDKPKNSNDNIPIDKI